MALNFTETDTVVKRVLPYLTRRGYDLEADLDFETPAKLKERYALGYVDIVVVKNGKPVFVIEAKRSSKQITAKDVKQGLSYGESLKVPFVVITNGQIIQCYNSKNGKPIKWNGNLIDKIPTKDQLGKVISTFKADPDTTNLNLADDTSLPFRPGLPLKQLNALISNCHDTIRKIEKNEESAFADFSKFLFLKLLEEKSDLSDFKLPYSYRFFELAERPASESDQVKTAIEAMISSIIKQTSYGEVLADPIKLKNPKTYHYIVERLASVSFHDSSLDSKGAAFEYFVRATLKGKKLGQYFTPRPLVNLMMALVGKEKVVNALLSGENIKVLDPACGTGGFLVFMMQESLRIVDKKYQSNQISKSTRDTIENNLKTKAFWGSDANESVACSAKMNMIIAGDGHTNIQAEDSLAKRAKNWSVSTADCDIILTNPPFGTTETDSLEKEDLLQYPLKSSRGQHLFLQKMIMCTKPGGEICTVIDEGVLNTDSYIELRKWIFTKCVLKAVIRLPEETFKPNKINVRSSVLYFQRHLKDDADLEKKYKVTFCDLQSLGFHGSGEQIRGFDFSKQISQFENDILNKNLGEKRNGYYWEAFDLDVQNIIADSGARLDLKYWDISLKEKIESLPKGAQKISELAVEKVRRGKSPSADSYVDEKDGFALVVKAGSNISQYGELIEAGDFIEKNIFEDMGSVSLKLGDILLASTGDGTLGKCCVYRSKKPAVCDGHVTIIRVDHKKVYPEYLCDYLRIGIGAEQVKMLYTGSTGLIELTPDHVDKIVVALPDLASQKKISTELRKAEASYLQKVNMAESELLTSRNAFK